MVAHWNAQPGLTPCIATANAPNRDRMIRTWAMLNPLWVEHWRAAIAFMGTVPLYTGGGPKKWRAELGWLFKEDNFVGVVEKMLAARTAPPATGPPVLNEFERRALAAIDARKKK